MTSSSEGTSKMSGLPVVARVVPIALTGFVPPPLRFDNPFGIAVCFRGRSGEGASLFGAGVGIEARRDAFP